MTKKGIPVSGEKQSECKQSARIQACLDDYFEEHVGPITWLPEGGRGRVLCPFFKEHTEGNSPNALVFVDRGFPHTFCDAVASEYHTEELREFNKDLREKVKSWDPNKAAQIKASFEEFGKGNEK